MNPPEITIGSKWRHNESGWIATIALVTSDDVIFTWRSDPGWSWMKALSFHAFFKPYVWSLDEAMREAGYILGPGQQWHKPEEFVEEDLPPVTDGGLPWRPVIQKEPVEPGDEYCKFGNGPWVAYKTKTDVVTSVHYKHRTRRPLPAVEEWIPLAAEELMNCYLAEVERDGDQAPTYPYYVPYLVNGTEVHITNQDGNRAILTPERLMRRWFKCDFGTTEWQPCKKLKEVSL